MSKVKNIDWSLFFDGDWEARYGANLYDSIFSTVYSAIINDLDQIELFSSENKDIICIAHREVYGDILELCLKYYVKIEDYELAVVIRDAIKEIKHRE